MNNWKNIRVCFLSLVISGLFFPCMLAGQNAPVSTIGSVSSYTNTASLTVTAANVYDIGSFSLKILYDPAIVQATSAVQGTLLGGNMSVNLNNPGVIFVSWYTSAGVTLTGSPVILTIDFTKVANGTSALTWLDDGISCSWYNSSATSLTDTPSVNYYMTGSVAFLSPEAPHTIAPDAEACLNTVASVPLRITGFQNIGKIALKLSYNATSAGFQSYTNTSGFPGLIVDGSQPGTVLISGIISPGGSGINLSDSTALVTLHFMITGANTDLVWTDDGQSCQYTGAPPAYFVLTDTPQSTYYVQGSLMESPVPATPGAITGPSGGNTCTGEAGVNFSVAPVQHAASYTWTLPPGAVITSGEFTNNITVTFSNTPGNWDVTVNGNNACGAGSVSPVFPLSVNTSPAITAQPVSPAMVNAGSGTALFTVEASGSMPEYQWQEYNTDWTDLSDNGLYAGTHATTLTVINPSVSMNGYRYRCIVSGICPPAVTSDGEATLTVSNLTGTGPVNPDQKRDLSLSIYPNPIIAEATLNYNIPCAGTLIIEVRNICGSLVNTIADSRMPAGTYKQKCVMNLKPGLYFIKLTLDSEPEVKTITKKIIVN